MPWALPLVGLDVLIVVLWTIAAALAIALIMTRIGAVVRTIPVVGGPLGGAFTSMAKAVTSACGALMGGIEGLVGAGLHLLARYLDKWLEQFVTHASLILHLAQVVGHVLGRVTGISGLVHQFTKVVHTVLHRFVAIGRELFHVERLVKRLEHDLAKGIGEDVLPRIKSLDRELHKVEHKVIPALEADVATATNDVTALRKWIADNVAIPGTQAFVGAIAVALGLLGLGGLRCDNLLGSLRNRGCGLWQGLEDILGLLFDAVIVADLCAMLPELERLFAEFEGPVVDLIASAADAACAQPAQGWSKLASPALTLPTVYYTGAVPGN